MTDEAPSKKTIAFELSYEELDLLYTAFRPAVARAKAIVHRHPGVDGGVAVMEGLLERLNRAGSLFP